MADTDQERTEDATPKRLEDARQKGQIPRSKDLGTTMVLLSAAIGMYLIGPTLAQKMLGVVTRLFSFDREAVFDVSAMSASWRLALWELAPILMIFFIIMFIGSIAGTVMLGGFNFSSEAASPKFSKMNPLSGLKRMFGVQSLVELVKSIGKFFVVAGVALFMLNMLFTEILQLSVETSKAGIGHGLYLLLYMFIALCCSLLLIVAIDVPYQIWNHAKELRMTKQEVKDEHKNTEGNPQIKGRIRRLQYEMSQRRMMADVPDADVIVTNPTHYAVALRYDVSGSQAPVVLAKGVDEVAMKIREIAQAYDIAIVSQPALTRAIYHSTDLQKEIPEGLFAAVAQVLAYVFQLKQNKRGVGKMPKPLPRELEVPTELRRD